MYCTSIYWMASNVKLIDFASFRVCCGEHNEYICHMHNIPSFAQELYRILSFLECNASSPTNSWILMWRKNMVGNLFLDVSIHFPGLHGNRKRYQWILMDIQRDFWRQWKNTECSGMLHQSQLTTFFVCVAPAQNPNHTRSHQSI